MPPIPRRILLRAALAGAALSLPLPRAALAAPEALRVAGPEDLAAALAAAARGDVATIRLAPGTYGRLAIGTRRTPATDFPRTVTLVSDDPADPAIFTTVALVGAGNLVLDGLTFDYRFKPDHPLSIRPFGFDGCRGLTIRDSVFDGDLAQGISPEVDGTGYGIALSIKGGRDIAIVNNRIHDFHRGMALGGARNVLVAGNELVGLRMDGMNFVAMTGVRIEGNYIHGFRRSKLKADHADMIQFWTNGSDRPSTGITIRGNLLRAGDGNHTQSIFMRNDLVDRGLAGPEMFYRDVLIEENVILNGHLHGITLGETKGAIIRRNTVLRDPAFAGRKDRERKVRIPRISVKEGSVGVVVADNITSAVPGPQPGWQITGNLLVQDLGRMQPGFYGLVFDARPPAPAAAAGGLAAQLPIRYLPGGPADRPGLGAAMMR